MHISITFTKCKWDLEINDRAVAILEQSLGLSIVELLRRGTVPIWEEKLDQMLANLDSYDPTLSMEYYKLAMVLEVLKTLAEQNDPRGSGSSSKKRKFGTEITENTINVNKKRKERALRPGIPDFTLPPGAFAGNAISDISIE